MKDSELKNIAKEIRIDVLKMLNTAKSGHTAGAMGLADIFAVLYFDIMNHNPLQPDWLARDFLILSNGHVCPVMYATLSLANYFEKDKLFDLRKINSMLQGHPSKNISIGIENSSGSLGQGISYAVGLAASLKRDKKKNKVFTIVGDGELQEGECWEAFLFAAKEQLDNLYVIVDRNFIQIDGNTEDVSSLEKLSKKMASFNFKTIEFDGNNISQIRHAIKESFKIKGRPICLIANTIAGKGVSFMENDFNWHGKAPDDNELKIALNELCLDENGK